ncbi:MAG: cytosine permease [Thaumarchaeota archaeon]|nr:cytosine permease [Nitrososphaerota archaeon]MCL5067919.1 cytosine permease [Nitrososphaerota archaeon]MDG6908332.1 cytosine permease [Nitrososphaerota archaeon]
MKSAKDKATEVEKLGIEHIPTEQRHGSASRTFTLWFAANLTIADYVIGVLITTVFGLTLLQSIPIMIVGNVLGGLVVGLSGAMGPKLGFPQMFSSRSSFGKRGNYIPGALNWISTAGWFTVNTILGTMAIQALIPTFNYYLGAILLVAVQVLIGIYGHDFIHLFERAMSVVLGLLFAAVFILAMPKIGSLIPQGSSFWGAPIGAAATTLAVTFSYIMSWSPYASDYTRYLPESTSKWKLTMLTLIGGALASFFVEVIGAIVGLITKSSDYFVSLRSFSGSLGEVVLIALILGAVAANALNIYTNSLSALVLDVRTKRWVTVLIAGIVGLVLALAGGVNFETNFENFLLILDYWITPWLAIVLVDFFVAKRTTHDTCVEAKNWDLATLGIYAAAVLVSVPFMAPPSGWIGPLANLFGQADFSYFFSFGFAAVVYSIYRSVKRS